MIAGGGTIPAERAYLDAEIMPRLGPGVRWLGELDFDRKVRLLGRAACLVFPARWDEPFGLVLVEAMACGTPVAALAAGAVPELVPRRDRHPVPGARRAGRGDRPGGPAGPGPVPGPCRAAVQRRPDGDRYENVYRRITGLDCGHRLNEYPGMGNSQASAAVSASRNSA